MPLSVVACHAAAWPDRGTALADSRSALDAVATRLTRSALLRRRRSL